MSKPKNVVVEYHLIRHMKTGKVGEGGVTRDQDRVPNDIGNAQRTRLQGALFSEGPAFDVIFYSPVLRALSLAESIRRGCPSIIPIPEMYDPDPASTDVNEAIDASILLKASGLFGYDLKRWHTNDIVVDAFTRRAEAAAEKIKVQLEPYIASAERPVRVAAIGHFLYLNELGWALCTTQQHIFRNVALGECDRFVIRQTPLETVVHVPLGEILTWPTEPFLPEPTREPDPLDAL